ncbi:transcriptional regulator [Aliidongia dinghuensis]|uniref:Transcriptional regulator n=1 Tax=Aliidongia dinghuensis TaxID=1867774 RepID=A0A8J2YPR4_9PROT|nr:transcriptional regulator GcvA [Aliidongia dinghuensis]GGF01076.1 transcriptional regulator [Aliidongia dinghuensis]
MTVHLPSLNGLRAFEAAARHLSFTLAAAELNVTQAAISHQIKRLEEQLNVQLFVRQNRALVLTRAAQDYLPAVRAAFDDLKRATERLVKPERQRVLTVSTISSLAAKWLVPRLIPFHEAHPDIEVRISTTMRPVDFRAEGIDLGIRYGTGRWPGLRADWLMQDSWFPVCSPALLQGTKPLRTPADLANHTLIHVEPYREAWARWLEAAGGPVEIAERRGLTFDLVMVALQAAIDGAGVALSGTSFVELDLAAGRLVAPFDFALPHKEGGFYVVAPEETADQPAVATFRQWLISSVGPRPSPVR